MNDERTREIQSTGGQRLSQAQPLTGIRKHISTTSPNKMAAYLSLSTDFVIHEHRVVFLFFFRAPSAVVFVNNAESECKQNLKI